MNNPTSTLGRTVKVMRCCVCVLALVLVFMAVGVGGVPSHGARAQGSPSMKTTDISTAGVEVAPTESTALTTATVSPDPSADGWNKDMATVTIRARYKAH